MLKNKGLKNFIALFLILFVNGICFAELTPEQVAQKTSSLISNVKGLEVGFTILTKSVSSKGNIKSMGKKFAISLPEMKAWFNGSDLYTLNERTKETTVVKPSAEELLETNPLLYIRAGGQYSYNFSPKTVSGKYSIELVPRNKKSEIKKLVFLINKQNFYPENITVSTGSGSISININTFQPNKTFPSSDFEYPATNLKNIEIVDLR